MTIRQARTKFRSRKYKQLQAKRERRRLRRLDAKYRADRIYDDGPVPNPSFLAKRASSFGKSTVDCPTHLDLSEHLEQTLTFLSHIQLHALNPEQRELYIDQSRLEKITPAAAVLLIAEIQRCLKMAPIGKRVRGNYPKDDDAARALADIGFYKYLNIPRRVKFPDSDRYIQVVSGRASDGRIVDQLIEKFEDVVNINPIARKRLYGSLIECMDNVHTHAYDPSLKTPDLLGEWWMAGCLDREKQQVAFIFYDQGLGIPTTLRTKKDKTVSQYLNWSPERMLEDAVMIGISRTGDIRHAQGLPSLKDFIDEVAASGYLHVMSNRASFKYEKNKKYTRNALETSVKGTLIAWSFQAEADANSMSEVTDQPI